MIGVIDKSDVQGILEEYGLKYGVLACLWQKTYLEFLLFYGLLSGGKTIKYNGGKEKCKKLKGLEEKI
jgi:hypothetical protein